MLKTKGITTMLDRSLWITPKEDYGTVSPVFSKTFVSEGEVESATLSVTSVGVYVATLSGERVGSFVLAPGWTTYPKRHQVQSYDVTSLIKKENTLEIEVAYGWYLGRLAWGPRFYGDKKPSAIAELTIKYKDGSEKVVVTDTSWSVKRSKLKLCEIYDGELYDASEEEAPLEEVAEYDFPKDQLIAQEGEEVREVMHIKPFAYIVTPKGERVIDFGQNLAGYISFKVKGNKGDTVRVRHFEILDKDGNEIELATIGAEDDVKPDSEVIAEIGSVEVVNEDELLRSYEEVDEESEKAENDEYYDYEDLSDDYADDSDFE